LALIGFSRAAVLDPTWSDPRDKEKNLTGYLEKLVEFIETKVGKILNFHTLPVALNVFLRDEVFRVF
jgi:hypothetical protein